MSATVLRPPQPLVALRRPVIFLAGSIEQGAAIDWQQRLAHELADAEVTLLNPRRDEWDASWVQSIDNPQFREQVEWELTGLELADLIVMYFAPGTRSPVTLLELGLHARSGKLVVCCPEGYWRKGNVDVVCRRYQVPTVDDVAGLAAAVRARTG